MSKYIKLEDALERAKSGTNNYYICKAIESLPTIEVSEDCISRERLISFIDAGHLRNPNEKCYSENDVVELIKNAPSVVPCCDNEKSNKFQQELQQAEVTTEQSSMVGEWIVYPLMDEGRVELECPKCGDTFIRAVDYRPHFCENCGAKMKG